MSETAAPSPTTPPSAPDPSGTSVNVTASPRPLNSLVASARRITTSKMTGGSFRSYQGQDWQNDAWEMYDLVGEQRFLASTLANRLGQALLYVGEVAEDQTAEPERVDDPTLQGVLEAFGESQNGRSQILARLGVNLFVAGDGWLVGVPKYLLPDFNDSPDDEDRDPASTPIEREFYESVEEVSLEDISWHMLSITEVRMETDQVTLSLGDSEKLSVSPDDIYLIRVWRPHPRRAWEADSPTRSSLPVLRELVGLTMHISAQVDSRLAGAGVFIVPQSAQRSLRLAAGIGEDEDTDVFTEALIEAMLKPISDRASASALVPLVVTVPDEVTDAFNFFTFAKPLDSEAKVLRDEAIRRLALGQDAPPELLLGVGGMNHWGAWLVREDVVTTHIEPPLALICDALTTQYLWPVLEQMGYAPETAHKYVIWYDVSHMIMRPNRAADAATLHDKGALSDAALREANGFEESDAPLTASSPEASLVLQMLAAEPSLAVNPGITALLEQARLLFAYDPTASDEVSPPTETNADTPTPEREIPQTEDDPAPDDVGLAASASPPPPILPASRGGWLPSPTVPNYHFEGTAAKLNYGDTTPRKILPRR